MIELRAQTGPVFLTYRASAAVDDLVAAATAAAPLFDFEAADGVRHTVWRAGAVAAARLVSSFACDTRALHRRRPSPRGQRSRARASLNGARPRRLEGDRRRAGRGVSRPRDAGASLQPAGEGPRRPRSAGVSRRARAGVCRPAGRPGSGWPRARVDVSRPGVVRPGAARGRGRFERGREPGRQPAPGPRPRPAARHRRSAHRPAHRVRGRRARHGGARGARPLRRPPRRRSRCTRSAWTI